VVSKVDGKGVVCRVKSSSVVVMTPDLGFVEICRQPGMVVGQEVHFAAGDLVNRRRSPRLLVLAASFIMLMLVSALALPRFASDPPMYAYVSVEVNPGVELALDRHLAVVDVRTLNVDGAAVVRDLDLKERPVVEAVAEVVRVWREQGYLGSETVRHLVVTTTVPETDDGAQLQTDLLEIVQRELEGIGGRTEIFVLGGDFEIREQARKEALSTADYIIWEQARKDGYSVMREAVQAGELRAALTQEGRDFGAAVAAAATLRARVSQDDSEWESDEFEEDELEEDEFEETKRPKKQPGERPEPPGRVEKDRDKKNRDEGNGAEVGEDEPDEVEPGEEDYEAPPAKPGRPVHVPPGPHFDTPPGKEDDNENEYEYDEYDEKEDDEGEGEGEGEE
jgi:hypothetical protein